MPNLPPSPNPTEHGFKTKKAARQAGLRTKEDWLKREKSPDGKWRKPIIPRIDAMPVTVKGDSFYRPEDCEEVISETEAKRRRLKISNGAQPVTELYYRYCGYNPVYRLSDFVPIPIRKEIPPKEIDLLPAIFTVNKAAKRFRDQAESYYKKEQHGFAGDRKSKKSKLYHLKDRGIACACRSGKLTFDGFHGGLATYSGEGYSFHSALVPEGLLPVKNDNTKSDKVFIEAVPKGTNEARLKDAVFTLEKLPDNNDGFNRVEVPRIDDTDQYADDSDSDTGNWQEEDIDEDDNCNEDWEEDWDSI